MSDASLSDVTALTERFLDLKKQIEDIEENQIKPLSTEVSQIQGKLITLLEANGLKKFASSRGSLYLMIDKKVDMPKGDDKFSFIGFMKEIGEWDAMATVHHATLNSWYKQKVEENPLFAAPGLGLPKENKYLKRGK